MKTSPFTCILPWGFLCRLQMFCAAEYDNNHERVDYEGDEEEEDEEAYNNDYNPLNENELNPCRRHPTWWGAGEGIVDYETMCQELTGWSPRDSLWRVDIEPIKEWLSDGKEDKIAVSLWRVDIEHINEWLSDGKKTRLLNALMPPLYLLLPTLFVGQREYYYLLPPQMAFLPLTIHLYLRSLIHRCNETDRTDACYVDESLVTAYYAHLEEGMMMMTVFIVSLVGTMHVVSHIL
jgi:hypothetical protein